jgi:hypothetical protein
LEISNFKFEISKPKAVVVNLGVFGSWRESKFHRSRKYFPLAPFTQRELDVFRVSKPRDSKRKGSNLAARKDPHRNIRLLVGTWRCTDGISDVAYTISPTFATRRQASPIPQ